MILILHYYRSVIDGVMTSMIDTFFNLMEFGAEMKFICPELYLLDRKEPDYYNASLEETQWHRYTDDIGVNTVAYDHEEEVIKDRRLKRNELTTSVPFLRFNRNFGHFAFFYSIEMENRKFEADIIICSATLLCEIMSGIDIQLKCKKLIVLDSFDTQRAKLGIIPNFDDLFDTEFKNTQIIQLSNPANFRDTKYEQYKYFHKFSKQRLDAVEKCAVMKDTYRFSRGMKEKTKIEEQGHFENIGKGIFEHLYFNKKVDYKTDEMYCKDGLWYYLDLLGINPDVDQTLKFRRSAINKNLFMKTLDRLRMEVAIEAI